MLIKENEESRKTEIEKLNRRIEEICESENTLKKTIQDLETEICDKNKVINIIWLNTLLEVFRNLYIYNKNIKSISEFIYIY